MSALKKAAAGLLCVSLAVQPAAAQLRVEPRSPIPIRGAPLIAPAALGLRSALGSNLLAPLSALSIPRTLSINKDKISLNATPPPLALAASALQAPEARVLLPAMPPDALAAGTPRPKERPILAGLKARAEEAANAPKDLKASIALNRLFDLSARGESEPVLAARAAAILAPARTLSMDLGPEAGDAELDEALKVYDSSLPKPPAPGAQAALAVWTALGVAGLLAFAWLSPWTGPLALIPRGMAAVEAIGYVFHRFFQHVSSLTRIDYPLLLDVQDPDAGHRLGSLGAAAVAAGNFIRRNQMYHWLHHMVIYPIGRYFHKAGAYISAETPPRLRKAAGPVLKLLFAPVSLLLSLGLSWLVAAAVGMGLSLAVMGLNWNTGLFLAAVASYGWLVGYIHGTFHVADHWTRRWPVIGPALRYLHDIHELHHYDQRKNFMILLPVDILFGTYMSPRRHQAELAVVREDRTLTASDIINWRYLLDEATPAQRAAYISRIRKDNAAKERIRLFLEVLRHRMRRAPEDERARDLYGKSLALLREAGKP